jgi:hypothetical protein
MDKKVKKSEMEAIVCKQASRKATTGKESTFRVRGRLVEQRKINQYEKEKNTDLQASAAPLSMASGGKLYICYHRTSPIFY